MNTKKSMAHCRVYLNLVRNIQPGSVSKQGGKTDDKSRHINSVNDLTHSVFIYAEGGHSGSFGHIPWHTSGKTNQWHTDMQEICWWTHVQVVWHFKSRMGCLLPLRNAGHRAQTWEQVPEQSQSMLTWTWAFGDRLNRIWVCWVPYYTCWTLIGHTQIPSAFL